jgi:hypothetical protein
MALTNNEPTNLQNEVVLPYSTTSPLGPLPFITPSSPDNPTLIPSSVFPIHHVHLGTNLDGP